MNSEDQRELREEAIVHGPAYQLAQEDVEFLASDELRGVRLQLELLKPEIALQKHAIRSTVVVFGSARTCSPEQAQAEVVRLAARAQLHPEDAQLAHQLTRARRRLAGARYYEEARRFAEIVSCRFQREGRRDFVVVTGGGPGIMAAANRGAHEAGARSIGFNVTLPHEQRPNSWITPELAFRFHYFAVRKMHFLLRAKALVVFPGGFGTLDELFEVLTLVQTGKMPRLPIVLVGSAFWRRACDLDFLVEQGMLDANDVRLVSIVENAEQAVAVLNAFYGGRPPT
ncbi:MAG: TIGR00730 family Rossman fold protein [Ottowia sp.]|nr:TIGR00730 family Rossman fold protein [Ottowia sp.]